MSYARVVLSAILALILGFFVAADLVLFGVVPVNSVVVTIVPLAAFVLGALLGVIPRKRQSGASDNPDSSMEAPVAQPAM